ncbi:hypothetical protein B2G71_21690 [Novosphingobium sp. PC22D]|uniref:alpha/beta fold hydrolase n=1 Tax=Novosphingobium sp. PC22D TaxID=1962403 RepID=UPI000BF12C4D|nr:alpha/beta hydrolase [Novosphingobium sp. PC22D]PEQ10592.1 hypothetical protein B2G71_21690 [Novosphingobium sp. PC22D]
MRIKVNGVRLYFDVEGAELVPDGLTMRQRPTLLLLHGGPGADHATFKPFMSRFADHAQVIYLDHRGQGRSDVGEARDWNLAQWADDVAGFLEALDIERPYLLGASFGGFVAQAFATRYPDRLAKLALVATAPRTDAELAIRAFTELGGEQVGAIARRFLSQDGGADAATDYLKHCVPLYQVSQVEIAELARSIDRPAVREHFFNTNGEWHTMDFRAGLARIACPTLVLNGRRDPVLPIQLAREMAEAIPAGLATQHIVENAGHGWADHPEEWAEVLRAFLFDD